MQAGHDRTDRHSQSLGDFFVTILLKLTQHKHRSLRLREGRQSIAEDAGIVGRFRSCDRIHGRLQVLRSIRSLALEKAAETPPAVAVERLART